MMDRSALNSISCLRQTNGDSLSGRRIRILLVGRGLISVRRRALLVSCWITTTVLVSLVLSSVCSGLQQSNVVPPSIYTSTSSRLATTPPHSTARRRSPTPPTKSQQRQFQPPTHKPSEAIVTFNLWNFDLMLALSNNTMMVSNMNDTEITDKVAQWLHTCFVLGTIGPIDNIAVYLVGYQSLNLYKREPSIQNQFMADLLLAGTANFIASNTNVTLDDVQQAQIVCLTKDMNRLNSNLNAHMRNLIDVVPRVGTPSPSLSPASTLYPTSTGNPSIRWPSLQPSWFPTIIPSTTPSLMPSQSPTISNKPSISHHPSMNPSVFPSLLPSISALPSSVPSLSPSKLPTSSPSRLPSLYPTFSFMPSQFPSRLPSIVPSLSPRPSIMPTISHEPSISLNPSWVPTNHPTFTRSPSYQPSVMPSPGPSWSPTEYPSLFPSSTPTILLDYKLSQPRLSIVLTNAERNLSTIQTLRWIRDTSTFVRDYWNKRVPPYPIFVGAVKTTLLVQNRFFKSDQQTKTFYLSTLPWLNDSIPLLELVYSQVITLGIINNSFPASTHPETWNFLFLEPIKNQRTAYANLMFSILNNNLPIYVDGPFITVAPTAAPTPQPRPYRSRRIIIIVVVLATSGVLIGAGAYVLHLMAKAARNDNAPVVYENYIDQDQLLVDTGLMAPSSSFGAGVVMGGIGQAGGGAVSGYSGDDIFPESIHQLEPPVRSGQNEVVLTDLTTMAPSSPLMIPDSIGRVDQANDYISEDPYSSGGVTAAQSIAHYPSISTVTDATPSMATPSDVSRGLTHDGLSMPYLGVNLQSGVVGYDGNGSGLVTPTGAMAFDEGTPNTATPPLPPVPTPQSTGVLLAEDFSEYDAEFDDAMELHMSNFEIQVQDLDDTVLSQDEDYYGRHHT